MQSHENILKASYQEELYQKTCHTGFVVSFFVILVYLFFVWQDPIFFPKFAPQLFRLRIVPMSLSLLYIILYPLFLRDRPRLGYFIYGINMVVIQICVNTMVFLSFMPAQGFDEGMKLLVVSGLPPLFMATYLVADGWRRYLWLLIALPPVVLVLALVFVLHVSAFQASYFSNPAFMLVFVIIMGLLDDRSRFREFKTRKFAEEQKQQLEIEVEHRKKAERNLEILAATDELTGLFNRRATIQILRKYAALGKRHEKDMTLFFIDMDNLKYINDVYGHPEGDTAIRKFSEVLAASIRESDHLSRGSDPLEYEDRYDVGRLGGDEFLVILFGCSKKDSELLIKRMSDNLTAINESGQYPYKLEFSYGAIEYDPDAPRSPEEMIEEADKIMYECKQEKKRRAGRA